MGRARRLRLVYSFPVFLRNRRRLFHEYKDGTLESLINLQLAEQFCAEAVEKWRLRQGRRCY